MEKHSERANSDPDFQYIWSQKALAEEISGSDLLPLNEAQRVAQRETQEAQYLLIENARRVAKGLEPIGSLDDLYGGDNEDGETLEATSSSSEPSIETVTTQDPDEEEDALIVETARILTDAINLSGRIMARADSR